MATTEEGLDGLPSSDSDSEVSSSSSDFKPTRNVIPSVIFDDSNSSFSDYTVSPPFSPIVRRERRNAIFQPVSPPHVTDEEVVETYHNEIEVASVSELDDNPIENANSTSGGEEVDMVPNTSGVSAGSNFRTLVGVDDPETLVNRIGPDEVKIDLGFKEDNPSSIVEDNDADIDAAKTQSQLSDAESVTLQDPPTVCHDAKKKRKSWNCVVCKSAVIPNFRYCLRCFRLRRNWLPKRPRSRRLKKRKTAERKATATTILSRNRLRCNSRAGPIDLGRNRRGIRIPSTSASDAQGVASTSQGLPVDLNQGFIIETDESNPVGPNSQPCSILLNETTETETPTPTSQCSSMGFQNSMNLSSQCLSLPVVGSSSSFTELGMVERQTMSQPVIPLNTETVGFSTNPQAQQNACSFCCIRPINSAFVHNKIAHQVSCYTCADKILKKWGKCPMCRERVFRVVKLILG